MTTFSRATYRSAGLLLLFLAVGAFLRIETLTKRPLWHDEIYTLGVVVTAHSLADIWAASGRDRAETPLLYYGAAYTAWHLHRNEKSIRFPACIVGILSIPLLGALAYRLAGIRAGLLSALLLTVSVYHIEYSQDARSYTLLIFLSLTALHGFLSFVRSRSIAGLLVLTLSVLASLYTHHSGFFVGGAIAVAGLAFILRRWWESGKFPLWLCAGLAGSAVVIALGFWPQVAHFRSFLESSDLDREHTLALTGHFFVELFNRWTFGAPWGIIAAGLLALGVIRSCKSFEAAVILFPWMAIPFLYFGFVPFGKFFDIRFVIAALPPFLILVGSGLTWLIDGSASALARLGRRPDTGRTSLNALMEALCLVFLAGSAVGPYLTFRRLELRCSDFYYRHEVLSQEHGFCRKHLIYASLYRRDSAGMLRKYQPSAKGGSEHPRADSIPHQDSVPHQ
jgi:mannosyltransferase